METQDTTVRLFKNLKPGDIVYYVKESDYELYCFVVDEIAFNQQGVKIINEEDNITLYCNGEESIRTVVEYGREVRYLTNIKDAKGFITSYAKRTIKGKVMEMNVLIKEIKEVISKTKEMYPDFNCVEELNKIKTIDYNNTNSTGGGSKCSKT